VNISRLLENDKEENMDYVRASMVGVVLGILLSLVAALGF
jgi:hypothetical protein